MTTLPLQYYAYSRKRLEGLLREDALTLDREDNTKLLGIHVRTILDQAAKKTATSPEAYKALLSDLHTDILLRMAAMDMPEAFDE
jgi:hypothetical protein